MNFLDFTAPPERIHLTESMAVTWSAADVVTLGAGVVAVAAGVLGLRDRRVGLPAAA